MYKIKILYIFSFLSIITCFKSQVLKFKQYTTKEGLVSDDVFNLHQDTKGYVWLFTNYGAMKYNGKTFEPVLKNLPFNESFIFSFYENNNGAKWAANSNAKIYEIKNDSAFVVKGTEKVSQTLRESVSEIFQLFVDKRENIFACTKSDSYKFIKSLKYQSFKINQEIERDSILHSAIEIGNNKILSVINYAGKAISGFYLGRPFMKIKFVDRNKKDTVFTVKCLVPSSPKCFKRFASGVYFSFYDKIIHINTKNKIKEIPINSIILNFTKDKNNHLWVACFTDGLYEFNEKDSLVNHYFENKTINDVLFDSQNGLWASSSGYGLFHCENLDEAHFTDDDFFGKPISFIKQLNNNIFIANNYGDVFSFKNNVLKKISTSKTILGEPLDIIETKDFYIVSSRLNTVRISKFDNKTIEFSPYKLGQHFYSYKMKMKGMDTLICLQRKDVIMLLSNKVVLQIPSKHKLHDIEIRNNTIILATDDGVYQIVNNKLVQPVYLNLTKNCIITKISKDPYNNYWFCSKGNGVFKLSPANKLVNYSTINNLPSNIINDINFISDTEILLSTNEGLYYSGGNIISNNWKSIYSEEVSSSSFYNNKLYLATKNGLVIIDKKKLNSTPSLYFNLSSVLVNSKQINFNYLKKLNYFENSIEFNFDLILYASSPLYINYKLIGDEKYSGTVKNQQINFQNLSPGSYTLIAAPNINGNEKYKISIPFNIIPAFWQTTWFILLCGLVLVAIICLIVWFIIKYRREKENKKNEVNRLILEYKLIALKAQINPHFMSNCLTAIQHLIISNKVDEANQYIAKFSFLVRQVLNFSTKSMVSLKEELEITELNIELEQLRFENKFDFEIFCEDSIDFKNLLVPPLILQPIIENAIWHGLLPLKNLRKGKLLVKISLLDDSLVIIIEDNGFGRRKGNGNIGNLRESKGIEIIKQRILNMNNLYNTSKGDFFIEDLIDALNNPFGTRATFILPLISKGLYE